MMKARQRELDDLCMRLAKGELTIREWGDEFDKVLLDGHTRAHMLGRQRGGDLRGLLDDDVFYGIASKDKEAYFVHGYMQNLADGDPRYLNDDGTINPAKMRNRNSLYVGRMRGSASEAWEGACPDDQQINWIMLAKEHCPDCPRMASLNPWDKGDLWAFPGSGDTQCLGNCIVDPNALVETINGAVPISNIQAGDFVLTHVGRYRQVLNAWTSVNNIERPLYEVHGPLGAVTCTPDHRWLTKDGWKTAETIHSKQLQVYTYSQDETLQQMRKAHADRPKAGYMQGLREGVRMRCAEGLQGGSVLQLREPQESISAMGRSKLEREDTNRIERWRRETAKAVQGFNIRLIHDAQAMRRSLLHVLLAGWEDAVRIPLQMGLANGTWSNPAQPCDSPHKYGWHGRQAGKPADAIQYGSPEIAHGVTATGWINASSTIPIGATLYDIEVEEDESFVVEGLVSHNCKCILRREDGEESFRHPSTPANAPDIPYEAADLDAAA